MFPQPLIHRVNKLISVGVFRAGIGKCNQVNGDSMPVKPNQKGGTVRAAPKGYNIQFYTSIKYHQFIRP